METSEEVDIIKSVLGGDRNSYVLLVDRYKTPIFNLAYRMTGSYEDASDLAQETFVKAFENLGRFDQEKKFFVWLYTIGLNLVRNHLKREQRIRSRDFTEDADLSLSDNSFDLEHSLMSDQKILPYEQVSPQTFRYSQGGGCYAVLSGTFLRRDR